MTKILGIEALIDYKFTSRLLLWEALQASGSPVRTIGDRSLGTDGNKSLAIVGDRILDTVLSLDWRNSRTHKGYFHLPQRLALGTLEREAWTDNFEK